jgi:putative transposase
MNNHVHLLVSGEEASSVGRMVQSLGRLYVRHFNTVHGRTGTLWEGRFRSSLVDSDAYLLACHRYIELNPVRACLVSRPADFLWSSHRYYVEGMPDDAVTPHAIWQEFGATAEARREAFAALFRVQLEEDMVRAIRDSLHHGWALGSPSFQSHLAESLGRRTKRARAGRPAGSGNRK